MEDYSLPVAFGAGLASFLSPCILPLVPVYLANLGGAAALSSEGRRWSILLHSLSFVAGFSAIFIGLGASAGLVGLLLPRDTLRIVGGVVLILFGVFLLAALKIPRLNYEARLKRSFGEGTGYLRSLLMGAAFSLGWTPCLSPVLGGIMTLAAASQTAWEGAALLAAYSLGLGLPFIAVGLSLGAARPALRWIGRHSVIISIVGGILLITIGILMLTNTLVYLNF